MKKSKVFMKYALILTLIAMVVAMLPLSTLAQTPKDVIVSIAQAEHGRLLFAEQDNVEKLSSVEAKGKSGQVLSLEVKSDEGYALESIELRYTETKETLPYPGESFGLVLKEDVLLIPKFKEGETVYGLDGASEFKEEQADTPYDYILKNMDRSKVGSEEGRLFANIAATYTFALSEMLETETLDHLWFTDKDGDGVPDNMSALLTQYTGNFGLYDFGGEYLVGLANTINNKEDFRVVEFVATVNEDSGVTIDDAIYDFNNGLVYFPKKHYTDGHYEAIVYNGHDATPFRLQLFVMHDNMTLGAGGLPSTKVDIPVFINQRRIRGDVFEEGVVTSNIMVDQTLVRMTKDLEAMKRLSKKSFIDVKVNGISLDRRRFSYDETTGVLSIYKPAVTVAGIEIQLENPSVIEDIYNTILAWFFPAKVKAQEEADQETVEYNDIPEEINDYLYGDVQPMDINSLAAHRSFNWDKWIRSEPWGFERIPDARDGWYPFTVMDFLGAGGGPIQKNENESSGWPGAYEYIRSGGDVFERPDGYIGGNFISLDDVHGLTYAWNGLPEHAGRYVYTGGNVMNWGQLVPGNLEFTVGPANLKVKTPTGVYDGYYGMGDGYRVSVMCAHQQVPRDFFYCNDGTFNRAGCDEHGGRGSLHPELSRPTMFRIMGGNSEYMVVAFVKSGCYLNEGDEPIDDSATRCAGIMDQPAFATIKVPWYQLESDKIDIKLQKTVNPAFADVIADNPAKYTFEGIQYGIYLSQADAVADNNRVVTLTLNASGYAESLQREDITTGMDLYTREVATNDWFGLNETVYKAVWNGASAEFMNGAAQPQDVPKLDPFRIRYGKVDKNGNPYPPENTPSLLGARFSIEYFAEGRPLTSPATRTWIYETDADGVIFFHKIEQKVGGDNLYLDMLGYPSIPFGTLRIKEVQAPDGYLPAIGYLKAGEQVSDQNELIIYHPGPEGGFYSVFAGREVDMQDAEVQVLEPLEIVYSGINVTKRDSQVDDGSQGDGVLVGARFNVINKSAESVTLLDGTVVPVDGVAITVVTDANGQASTGSILPEGTYHVVEVLPPNGYLPGTAEPCVAQGGLDEDVACNFNNDIMRSGVRVQKFDHDLPGGGSQQGSLAGAVFAIINQSQLPVVVDGQTYAVGATVTSITTNADGLATTPARYLPYGSYLVRETTPPTGYLGEGVMERTFQVREDNVMVDLTSYETGIVNRVARGGVMVRKFDEQIHTDQGSGTQGDGTLEGAHFAIINKNSYAVIVDGTSYGPDETIVTIVTDATGLAQTSNSLLPLGAYQILETTPPTGYLGEGIIQQDFEITENGQMVDLTSYETGIQNAIIHGGVRVQKLDADNQTGDPQGDASLAGAVFEITNQSALPVYVIRDWFDVGEVVLTLTTDAQGIAESPNDALPYGTYKITEITPPTGYLGEGVTERTFQVREHGVLVDMTDPDHAIINPVIRGGVQIRKYDVELDDGTAQGDASLAGAEFAIINNSAHPVVVDGQSYLRGETVLTIVTNAGGLAETGPNVLPYGSYKILEITPPTGYLGEGTIEREFEIRENGVIVDMTAYEDSILNKVIRGGVRLQKRDKETGLGSPLGGAKLNAVFQIFNESQRRVYVDGVWYEVGDMVLEITADEKTGVAETAADLLPYGTYRAIEVTPPEGYLGPDEKEVIFEIREHGVVVDLTGPDTSFYNQVKRGDLYIRKIDANTQQTLRFVSFRITSTDTGETHDVMTDINGEYYSNSAYVPHTHDTNGGNWDSGTWFGQYTDENGEVKITDPDDDLPAFPYGHYTIEELPGPHNEGYEMWKGEFTIYRHNIEVKLNNIENWPKPEPGVETELSIGTDGKLLPLGQAVRLQDMVYYGDLKANETYTYKLTLMSKSRQEAVSEVIEHEFKTRSAVGQFAVKFTLDTREFDCKDTYVAFGELYLGDELIVEHKDYDDVDQSVTMACVSTKALNADTNAPTIKPSDEMKIRDTVTYEGLEVGMPVVLKAQLMQAVTLDDGTVKAEAFLDKNGQPVLAETSFTTTETNGSADVLFVFSAPDAPKTKLVVFQELFVDGVLYAEHKDINDSNQTVDLIPDEAEKTLRTELTAKAGGKIITMAKDQILVDEVFYTGLAKGQTCTLKGQLMLKRTGGTLGAIVEKTFTAEAATGSVKMELPLDGTALEAGDQVVAFQELWCGDKLVAQHKDINDAAQTVSTMKLETILTNFRTDGHGLEIDNINLVLVDELIYEGAPANQPAVIKGMLMTPDGKLFKDANGKEAVTEHRFTPTHSSGSVKLEFVLNVKDMNVDKLIAYEYWYNSAGELIAQHTDLHDIKQTVNKLGLKTEAMAVNAKSKVVPEAKDAQILDRVTVFGTYPGDKYILIGWVVDKTEGGKVISSEIIKEFVGGEGTSTVVDMILVADTAERLGHELVVYQKLYARGRKNELVLLATHENLQDKDQTVTVRTKTDVETFAEEHTGLLIGMAAGSLALAGGATALIIRKKKKDEASLA